MGKGVKGFFKNRFFAGMFMLVPVFLLIFFDSSAGEKHLETGVIGIEGKNEILVAKDVSNRRPIWCGRKQILVYSATDDDESVWEEIWGYDVETRRKFKIADGSAPIACTPDGEWLLYRDHRTYRQARGNPGKAVVDLWRYEFKAKKSQPIAIAYETEIDAITFGENILSPNELKLYLGKKPVENVEMSEPKWKIIWSQAELHGAVWLPDFSGIVSAHFNRKDKSENLVLESLDPDKKAVIFKPPLPGHVRGMQMAGPDRIYMILNKIGAGFGAYGKNIVVRCEINLGKAFLSCVDMLELDHDIRDYTLFQDGEAIAFMQDEDQCVRIKRKGEQDAPCATADGHHLGNYVTVSPDNKWLAFDVFRKRDGENSYAQDLYVVKLTNQVR